MTRIEQTTKTVPEPGHDLPVAGEYDLIVAGGGIAGVAAAVAAARNGISVCLLEKACALGGLATLGNVTIWLPLCDGRGRQVTAGLPEELLKLSVADLGRNNRSARFVGIPTCWQPGGDPEARKTTRYRVSFNPTAYLLALEKLVVDAGVKILYDTRVCALLREDDRISHLIVENKSGRQALSCQTAIDATGDADLCNLAGERTESLDTNVLTGWYYCLTANGLQLSQMTNAYSPTALRDDAEGPFFQGDDADQVTAQILGSRELIRQKVAAARIQEPNGDMQVVSLPSLPCFRMTRRLVSDFSLGERHMHQWFDDTIGLTGDWRKSGPVYALPWRSLRAVDTRNLLAAGRCISADNTIWDVTRAIPACAVTGAACGVAAALAHQQTAGDCHALSVENLQHRLRAQGNLLDPALVLPCSSGAPDKTEIR